MRKTESHACVSDGLGLESVGHEDGGPWKLVVRATGKFLAIVRFCPWCGKKLIPVLSAAQRKKNVKKLLKLAEQIRKDGTFKKPVRRLGQ